MIAYIIRRLAFGAVLIFFSTILSFTILKLSPGMEAATDDPLVSKEYLAQQDRMYGADQPAWKQYCNWLGLSQLFDKKIPPGLLEGSLGKSRMFADPVSHIIAPRLRATLVLNVITVLFTWLLAVPLGTYAAVKQYRLSDKTVTVFSFIGMSLPGFFLGLVLLWLFASRWQWLPPGGLRDELMHEKMTYWGAFLDYLHHLIVPVVVLTFGALAGLQRVSRANTLEVLGQQYIVTARAKGLSEWTVIAKHALRNALNPLVTLLGFEFAGLFGGAALLEIVLNFPGMGQALLNALYQKDRDLVMSIFLIGSITLVIGNLIGDLLLAVVDPRISHQ